MCQTLPHSCPVNADLEKMKVKKGFEVQKYRRTGDVQRLSGPGWFPFPPTDFLSIPVLLLQAFSKLAEILVHAAYIRSVLRRASALISSHATSVGIAHDGPKSYRFHLFLRENTAIFFQNRFPILF